MSKPDVVVLRQKIHGQPASTYAELLRERLPGYEIALARTPDEERELLKTARVATGYDVQPAQLERAENLELFACVYAGTGHLDLDAFREHGVAVTNASGVHGPNMSEWVVGAMVTFARQWRRAMRQQDRREWRKYETSELNDSTVTVVGLGAIGQAVVDRLEPFGVELLGVRYTPDKGGPTDEVYGFDEIHEPLADSDYVVLACPLTETTEGLIDEQALRTIPPNAVVINVARGPVVDTGALVDALRADAIGGAALDVTDPEPLPEEHSLWGLDNAFITPHNAGNTPEYFERVSEILAENVEDAAETGYEQLRNQVT